MLTELRKFIRLLRASYQNKEVDVFFLLFFLLYIFFYGFFQIEFHHIYLWLHQLAISNIADFFKIKNLDKFI